MGMSIRFDYVGEDQCITILEVPPCRRNIMYVDRYVSGGPLVINVPFPYLIFVFHYRIVPGGYCYDGIKGINGDYPTAGYYNKPSLRVLFAKKSLETFDDIVCAAVTEHHDGGAACTDHSWDGQVFRSPELMMGTILDLWWNTAHTLKHNHFTANTLGAKYHRRGYGMTVYNEHPWSKMTSEEVLTYDWSSRDNTFSSGSARLQSVLPKFKYDELINEPVGVLPSSFSTGKILGVHDIIKKK